MNYLRNFYKLFYLYLFIRNWLYEQYDYWYCLLIKNELGIIKNLNNKYLLVKISDKNGTLFNLILEKKKYNQNIVSAIYDSNIDYTSKINNTIIIKDVINRNEFCKKLKEIFLCNSNKSNDSNEVSIIDETLHEYDLKLHKNISKLF